MNELLYFSVMLLVIGIVLRDFQRRVHLAILNCSKILKEEIDANHQHIRDLIELNRTIIKNVKFKRK